MKRLFFLGGLLLAFATPDYAKTDTIRFTVAPRLGNSTNDTLRYSFSNTVKDDITINWIAENGTKENFVLDENGKYTQAISSKGEVSIYYSYEQSNGYSAQISWLIESVLDITVRVGSTRISNINVSGCTALTHLKCDLNELTNLDLSGCTSLTYLNCNQNLLTNLDVSECTALASLSCINNRLTNLNINNPALEALYCTNNQLTNLDVSGCSELEYLSCFYNQLTTLNINECKSLVELKCDQNLLTSLDVSGCTTLTKLKCDKNQLTDLNVSGCTSLTELEYLNGQLERLNASGCTALTSLLCYQNQLTALDISGCTALTELRCDNNNLISLDVSSNTALQDLYCSSNYLTDLDIRSNPALMSLICSDNQLTDLDVSQNVTLVMLSCEKNRIPLSTLYNIDQQTELQFFNANQQSDSVFLTIDQSMDLSSESMIGDTPTSFQLSDVSGEAVSSDFYTENNLIFQFSTPRTYRLSLQNPNLNSNISGQSLPITFTWHVSVQLPEGYFSVQVVSNDTNWGTATITGNGTYKKDSMVTVTATPKESYRFINWTKGNEVFSTDSVHTFRVSENLELTANFERLPEIFTINVSSNNSQWGTATITGTGSYENGSEVTITANSNNGYHFVNWTKGSTIFSTDSVHTFKVTENLELTANFEKLPDDVANEPHETDNLRVYAQDRTIYLSENRGTVQVYNVTGQCVYSGTSTAIPVQQSGVYIVRVGTRSHKVLVR